MLDKLFTFKIDLGQVILAGMIGVLSWLIKRTIDSIEKRIEKHEQIIFDMNGKLQLIVGSMGLDKRFRARE